MALSFRSLEFQATKAFTLLELSRYSLGLFSCSSKHLPYSLKDLCSLKLLKASRLLAEASKLLAEASELPVGASKLLFGASKLLVGASKLLAGRFGLLVQAF